MVLTEVTKMKPAAQRQEVHLPTQHARPTLPLQVGVSRYSATVLCQEASVPRVARQGILTS